MTENEEPRAKFCRECGGVIEWGAKECPHCGVSLDVVDFDQMEFIGGGAAPPKVQGLREKPALPADMERRRRPELGDTQVMKTMPGTDPAAETEDLAVIGDGLTPIEDLPTVAPIPAGRAAPPGKPERKGLSPAPRRPVGPRGGPPVLKPAAGKPPIQKPVPSRPPVLKPAGPPVLKPAAAPVLKPVAPEPPVLVPAPPVLKPAPVPARPPVLAPATPPSEVVPMVKPLPPGTPMRKGKEIQEAILDEAPSVGPGGETRTMVAGLDEAALMDPITVMPMAPIPGPAEADLPPGIEPMEPDCPVCLKPLGERGGKCPACGAEVCFICCLRANGAEVQEDPKANRKRWNVVLNKTPPDQIRCAACGQRGFEA
ncbi:MAG: hypothetical protein MUE73_15235 [Planctomycetes bacterium]|nr:hypothetical protein [Planctomycetota bacterium]